MECVWDETNEVSNDPVPDCMPEELVRFSLFSLSFTGISDRADETLSALRGEDTEHTSDKLTKFSCNSSNRN